MSKGVKKWLAKDLEENSFHSRVLLFTTQMHFDWVTYTNGYLTKL